MEETKQQVPEELLDVVPSDKGATPDEPQKPAGLEASATPAVVPDLSAVENAEGAQEEKPEPKTEEEEEIKLNTVPQERFDEVYGKQKHLEREIRLLKKAGNVPTQSIEIGGANVKEVLALSREQSDKLDEWYEKDPMSAQAWVNDKTQEVRQISRKFNNDFASNQENLQEKHPDMFVVNPNTGRREVLDLASEKGKVFNQVANENPYLLDSPQGPKVAMLLMEERLGIKGGSKVKTENAIEKGKKMEAARVSRLANTPVVSSSSAPRKRVSNVRLTPGQEKARIGGGLTREEYIANMRPSAVNGFRGA